MRVFKTLTVVSALVVAACSPGGAEQTTTTPAPQGETQGAPRGETLQDFIPGMPSFDVADPAVAEAQARQLEQRVQELVARCMADQGFEYIPYVPNLDFGGFDQEQYVAEFGFGYATELVADQDEMQRRFEEEMAADPNQAIIDAMTPQELDAYQEALWGAAPDIDPETMTEEEIQAAFENFQPSGCMAEAQNQVYNSEAAQAFFLEFGPKIEEVFRSVESDPRILELQEKWAECMREKGYDFASTSEAELYILRQLEALGVVTDLEVGPNGELMGLGMTGVEPDDDRIPQIQAIADEEVEIAVAAFACEEQFTEVYREVQQEYEQRFIDENRADLERFREEYGG